MNIPFWSSIDKTAERSSERYFRFVMMIILNKAIPARLSCTWFQKERANAVGFPWSMYVFLLLILIICPWEFAACSKGQYDPVFIVDERPVLFEAYFPPMNLRRTFQ